MSNLYLPKNVKTAIETAIANPGMMIRLERSNKVITGLSDVKSVKKGLMPEPTFRRSETKTGVSYKHTVHLIELNNGELYAYNPVWRFVHTARTLKEAAGSATLFPANAKAIYELRTSFKTSPGQLILDNWYNDDCEMIKYVA